MRSSAGCPEGPPLAARATGVHGQRCSRRAAFVCVCAAALWLGSRAGADSTGGGFTIEAQLEHAAFRTEGVPSVIVHAPRDFDAKRPLQLVVFLHGYTGCIPVLMGKGETHCRPHDPPQQGWDLGRHHDAAHTNTLFVVPQLALMKRSGRPGTFGNRGGFRLFLEELLAGPISSALGSTRTLRDVAGLHLVAHSAGYQTAIAILEQGGVTGLIKSVVLLDALYGETPRFARFVEAHAAAGLRFVSLSLDRGTPRKENRALLTRLRHSLGPERVATTNAAELARTVAAHPIVIGTGIPPHRLLPATHLAELLRALQPGAAP